jgi:hypothetical protein
MCSNRLRVVSRCNVTSSSSNSLLILPGKKTFFNQQCTCLLLLFGRTVESSWLIRYGYYEAAIAASSNRDGMRKRCRYGVDMLGMRQHASGQCESVLALVGRCIDIQ